MYVQETERLQQMIGITAEGWRDELIAVKDHQDAAVKDVEHSVSLCKEMLAVETRNRSEGTEAVGSTQDRLAAQLNEMAAGLKQARWVQLYHHCAN